MRLCRGFLFWRVGRVWISEPGLCYACYWSCAARACALYNPITGTGTSTPRWGYARPPLAWGRPSVPLPGSPAFHFRWAIGLPHSCAYEDARLSVYRLCNPVRPSHTRSSSLIRGLCTPRGIAGRSLGPPVRMCFYVHCPPSLRLTFFPSFPIFSPHPCNAMARYVHKNSHTPARLMACPRAPHEDIIC